MLREQFNGPKLLIRKKLHSKSNHIYKLHTPEHNRYSSTVTLSLLQQYIHKMSDINRST